MTEPTIICPNCKTEIKLTESLAAPLLAATKQEFEKRLAQKDADVAKRESTLREQEAALSKAKEAIDDQVAEKLKLERTKIAAEEAKKARVVAANEIEQKTKEINELNYVLKQRDEKLAEAQKAQADLIRKQRELDDAKREIELTVEKRIQEGLRNGVVWTPPRGVSPRFPADALRHMDENDEIWFGTDGKAIPSRKTFLSELKVAGPPAPTVWLHSDAGNNHEAREEVKAINPNDPFATPKPEKLLKRVLELATMPGDLVLDSFAGSGTTGAVAQKMGRRWIMVELGEHCHTHIIPRLQKVIEGEDQGGISKAVNWQGGGGFRYYRLAPSLLEKDKWGNWVINHDYNATMLSEALCKLEGFTYGGKPWRYVLIPHDEIADNITLTGLAARFSV